MCQCRLYCNVVESTVYLGMAKVIPIIDVLGCDEQFSSLPCSYLTPITQNVRDGVGTMSCEYAGEYISQGCDTLLDYAYIIMYYVCTCLSDCCCQQKYLLCLEYLHTCSVAK